MQSVRTLSRHCPIGESKRLPPSPITGGVSHQQRFRVETVGILHLTAPLAIVRSEQVAQYGEKPPGHIGARLEGIEVGPRPQQRFLHEIVGAVDVAAERNGDRAGFGPRAETKLP
jgi:hypothetical protein